MIVEIDREKATRLIVERLEYLHEKGLTNPHLEEALCSIGISTTEVYPLIEEEYEALMTALEKGGMSTRLLMELMEKLELDYTGGSRVQVVECLSL